MTVLSIILVLFLGVLIAAVLRRFVKLLKALNQLEIQYGLAVRGFFDAARPLLEDDEVPTEVRSQINVLSEHIDDRSLARKLFRLARKRKRAWNGGSGSETMKIATEFFARRKELESSYHDLLAHWFVAVTARSPIHGMALRVLIFNNEPEMHALASRSASKLYGDRDKGTGTPTDMAEAAC